jgi:membrane-bound lytic murein transglycosylase D
MIIKRIFFNIIKLALFISTLIVAFFQTTSAQNVNDSSKKVLLALVEKKAEPRYITKPSNVVFPEILKGNETETLDYIEKFSKKRREYLIRMYTKGKQFLPKAATILNKYDLPAELKILLTLESAYNGNAVSKAGAVGYWQIMDEVAREYGMKYIAKMSEAEKKRLLKQKSKKGTKSRKSTVKLKDDRKNFNTSTHTAARYLRDRRRNLDDNWLLVVASYNCGIGNVWKAMERSGQLSPTFWDIQNFLPAETRAYVMNFITLNVIFHNYDLFLTNKLKFTPEKMMVPAEIERVASEEYTDYYEK